MGAQQIRISKQAALQCRSYRVPCAWGQKKFCKSAKEVKVEHLVLLLLLFIEVMKYVLTLKTHIDKATSVGGSNNAGVWKWSSQPLGANGDRRFGDFTTFFQNIRIFTYMLV